MRLSIVRAIKIQNAVLSNHLNVLAQENWEGGWAIWTKSGDSGVPAAPAPALDPDPVPGEVPVVPDVASGDAAGSDDEPGGTVVSPFAVAEDVDLELKRYDRTERRDAVVGASDVRVPAGLFGAEPDPETDSIAVAAGKIGGVGVEKCGDGRAEDAELSKLSLNLTFDAT